MNNRFLVIAAFLCVFAGELYAATVDTVDTYSPSMKKNIKAVVVKPDSYDGKQDFPAVYLLHGYSGNYLSWIAEAGDILKDLSDRHQTIIVCPDGDFNSWYFDSPVDPTKKYETYVAKELVSWIDKHYSTIKSREGRGITGLSMGGHGAFYLAFKHQDVFGVAGSMSGGVDLRPFPNNWDMAAKLGTYAENREVWDSHSVVNLTHLLTPGSLSLIFDCGTGDFFYQVNVKLHEKLLERNIPHDFTSRPGGHTWDYWRNSVKYHLLYMADFFQKTKGQNRRS